MEEAANWNAWAEAFSGILKTGFPQHSTGHTQGVKADIMMRLQTGARYSEDEWFFRLQRNKANVR